MCLVFPSWKWPSASPSELDWEPGICLTIEQQCPHWMPSEDSQGILLAGALRSEVEKSRPISVLNSLVSVTVLQPLLLVCVDLERSAECRCKVSGDLERCVGEERLSIYPPSFSTWVYEINWQQAHWGETITNVLFFSIMCVEASQEKTITEKVMRFESLCTILIGEGEEGCEPLRGEILTFRKGEWVLLKTDGCLRACDGTSGCSVCFWCLSCDQNPSSWSVDLPGKEFMITESFWRISL